MATPYDSTNTGGTLPLPRVHIPSWFRAEEASEYNDALLDLNLLVYPDNTQMYDNNNILDSTDNAGTKILDLGGENKIEDTTNNIYKNVISAGNIPPRQGDIIAYSDNTETFLNGTQSAHVLYFEHAALNSFNFAVTDNHVIQRINKIYRSLVSAKTGATLTELINSDTVNSSSYKMIINDSDATVTAGTTVLTLVEGGH